MSKSDDGEVDIRVGVAGLTSMWTGALSATQLRDYNLLRSRDDACDALFHLAISSPNVARTLVDVYAMMLCTGH